MGFSFLEHTYSDLMVTLYHMLSTVSTPLRKLFVESISFFLFLYMRQNKILPYYQGITLNARNAGPRAERP